MDRTSSDLIQRQSLPLRAKILMTQHRIREWYEHWDGQVYVSFSGGKDSTVLKHIIDSMYDDVPAVFVNTGLEYPQIQRFVREVKDGKYNCFNTDVEIMRPQMRFDEVINTYGFPVISKQISQKIYEGRRATKNGHPDNYATRQFNGQYVSKNGKTNHFSAKKWKFLYESDIPVSHKCCSVMKKTPVKQYEKTTGRKPFIAIMAEESLLRRQAWMRHGCNAFDSDRPTSQPMSFWTEQDVLHYIRLYNVPYATIYGDIVEKSNGTADGQMCLSDYIYTDCCDLETTGAKRTGCMFCMYGVHNQREPNRFQRMKETHPKQYAYCMEQLGLRQVLEYIGVPYE